MGTLIPYEKLERARKRKWRPVLDPRWLRAWHRFLAWRATADDGLGNLILASIAGSIICWIMYLQHEVIGMFVSMLLPILTLWKIGDIALDYLIEWFDPEHDE